MQKSTFHVQKMDCSSEEQLVKMKLQDISGVQRIAFNIPTRHVDVYHAGDSNLIEQALATLNLDSKLLVTKEESFVDSDTGQEKKVLVIVLLINAAFFVIELSTGIIANSMGLIGDSLDMLADVIVYGLSLYAVGHSLLAKKKVAKYAGYLQALLAIFGFVEVIRRFLGFGDVPIFQLMIGISVLALAGNVASLLLLYRVNNKEAHIRASWICTSNDVLVNVGVILAGVLVYLTDSNLPDLIIGSIVFSLVARGAYRILKLSK